MGVLSVILSISISLVFLFSGFAKLSKPRSFADTIESIGFHKKIAVIGGYALPFFEIILGILLLINESNIRIMTAALIAVTLLFIILISFKMMRENREVPCGCFGGVADISLGRGTMVHAGFLLLSLILSIIWHEKSFIDYIGDFGTAEVCSVLLLGVTIMMSGITIRVLTDMKGREH